MRTGTAVNRRARPPVELYWTRHDVDRGRPLLLVNGLGSPLVAFEPGFVAELGARGFSVTRFDNRDIGRSTRIEAFGWPVPPYTLADMAADAVAVLDAAGWPAAHVLGQSMGGMIAQRMAIDHPGRVASLISVMSASGEPGYGISTEEAATAILQPAPRDPEQWLDHRVATEKVWASPDHWDEDWVRAKGQAMLRHGIDPDGAFRQFRAVHQTPSRDPELARLDVPTLVIHGSADPLITPCGGRHVANVVPGARYVEIEGMGHDLPPGLWARLADEVAGFVAELGRQRGWG